MWSLMRTAGLFAVRTQTEFPKSIQPNEMQSTVDEEYPAIKGRN